MEICDQRVIGIRYMLHIQIIFNDRKMLMSIYGNLNILEDSVYI